MSVGMSPIIPLYRVQTDPNARFQRFGVNDSQLFGKPLLSVPQAPVTPQEHPVVRKAVVPQQNPEDNAAFKPEQPLAGALNATASVLGYSVRQETVTQVGTAPKPGSYVNLKA